MSRPERVGVLAMEVYFPRTYVAQARLEEADGCVGKYTRGLEQRSMSFATDREDINSLCLTVVDRLLNTYGVGLEEIGRMEVGTESFVDKSKSVKSVLMTLFADAGCTDIEGADTMNACYGGTNALFNAVHWVESSSWDGRLALVVTGDLAVYASGPARATGGCGAVALLVGPCAPIALVAPRASHMEHAYDFYKPCLASPYPVVDGPWSVLCYGRALDTCYRRFCQKYAKLHGREYSIEKNADYVLFHSPYQRLVRKSFGRLVFVDIQRGERECDGGLLADAGVTEAELKAWLLLEGEESYSSRELQSFYSALSKESYARKAQVADLAGKELGNLYAASLYGALLSLVCCCEEAELDGKEVLLYSYGSGLASTMFSMHLSASPSALPGQEGRWSLGRIRQQVRLQERIAARMELSPEEFTHHLAVQEERGTSKNLVPTSDLSLVTPGAFYLEKIDDKYRRSYARNVVAHEKL